MTTGNGADDRRVASLEEARRRKAEQDKAARRAGRGVTQSTLGQQVFGFVMIAMAVGFIAWGVGAFSATTMPVETSQ